MAELVRKMMLAASFIIRATMLISVRPPFKSNVLLVANGL